MCTRPFDPFVSWTLCVRSDSASGQPPTHTHMEERARARERPLARGIDWGVDVSALRPTATTTTRGLVRPVRSRCRICVSDCTQTMTMGDRLHFILPLHSTPTRSPTCSEFARGPRSLVVASECFMHLIGFDVLSHSGVRACSMSLGSVRPPHVSRARQWIMSIRHIY